MALNIYGANSGLATMYDFAARLGKDGKDADKLVVELQAQCNDIWSVLPFKECNDGTTEKVLLRKSLPEVAWRMINKGVKPTKSASSQAVFSTGGVESLADVDVRLLQLNKNSSVWRANENFAHQEAMSQKMCQTIFYGDEKLNPAGFTGLGAFFYSKANQDSLYADQIIDAGGTGNNLTSVWMVTFAQDTVYGIHPAGVAAGYHYEDKGTMFVTDAEGGNLEVARSKYNWDMGLAIRDPRHIVRIANIDVTNTSNTELVKKMIEGFNQLYNPDHGKTVLLCNRKVQTLLSILAADKSNVNLSIDEWAGKKMTHFYGAPIIRNDAILSTEEKLI